MALSKADNAGAAAPEEKPRHIFIWWLQIDSSPLASMLARNTQQSGFSGDKETAANGGVLINPTSGDTRFELTKLDPAIYNQILNLDENQISLPVLDEDRSGNKKYKILKVTNRYDQHQADFATDYVKIKDLALKEKQLDAIQNWMAEKIDDTFVNVNRSYRDCDFSNKWVQ